MTGALDIGEEGRAQAAEYVLGLLQGDELDAFEARLATSPDLRDSVAEWAEDFVTLTDPMPEIAAPPRIWNAISETLFGIEKPVPFLRRFSITQFFIGVAAAAAIALAMMQSGLLLPELRPEFRADVVAEDQSIRFRAEYDADTGNLKLVNLAGGANPGRSLELWLIAENAAPVSVMVWPTGAKEEQIILPAPLAASLPGGTLAISDEPEGGSPTGSPTGAVLAVGLVVDA